MVPPVIPPLKRPLLVGGVGLATGLWLVDSLAQVPMDGGGLGLTGLLALSAGVWWLQRRSPNSQPVVPDLEVPQIDRAMVEGAIAQARTTLDQLAAETTASETPALAQLQVRLAQLSANLDRQTLQVALVGGQAVGKSSLAHGLARRWQPKGLTKVQLLDTPQLFANQGPVAEALTTNPGSATDWAVPQVVLDADLTLFVTAGDVTDTERRCVDWLKARVARLIVVVNKQDQYLPEQQTELLSQVRKNLKGIVAAGDVVAIAAQPTPLRILQHSADGSSSQLQAPSEPELALLLDRLDQLMVAEPPQQLVWATLCHRANGLATAAKALLNQLRRQRASKAIDQYQWVAAGAAFINPVPTLDLLATAAVNSQLILDLSKIYRQTLSPDHAKTMATTLAEMLIKLGLVEVSSKLLGIALKSNGVTYLAGGLIQGASAAYLTRTVGQSLVEYFELLEVTGELPEVKALEQLQQVVQQTFQASRQSPMLQGFAKQALNRLGGETVKEMASGTVSGAVGETASASS